jgi:hypothetical protein
MTINISPTETKRENEINECFSQKKKSMNVEVIERKNDNMTSPFALLLLDHPPMGHGLMAPSHPFKN